MPVAHWQGDDEVPTPSAIPQNAQLARPDRSSLYDPMVLYADATIPTGASIAPNTAALQNPHALPMELLAVKFRIHTINLALTGPTPESVSGLGVGVKLDMGRVPLVDAGTPVSLCGTARDDSDDSGLGYNVFTNVADMEYNTDAPIAQVYDYLWRLRYPLFIPPSAVVTPLFSHLSQTPFPVKIGVTYYCRTYRQSRRAPQFVMLPWVSKYLSKSFDVGVGANAAEHDASSELDIHNPFPSARIELQRLTGRVNYYITGDNGTSPNSNWERGYSDQIYRFLRASIRSSRGDEIVRTPTLFGLLFPQVFKSWELGDWFMEPNEYYKVNLARDAFTGPDAAGESARMQVGIGAVGYRKINTSTLEGAL